MSNLRQEIEKRRTFAIISHPDAGKTTLTEKFLLYGGAINQAGSVKGKATAKHAVSDWMEIEKQRGISVTSSVLQFNYDGYCINILIHRDIRTSRRTHTVHLWQQILLSWLLMQARVSKHRHVNYLRYAL